MSADKQRSKQKEYISDTVPIRIVNKILGLPRIIRIMIAAFFAIATTLAIREIVDEIYLEFFYSESTRIIPSLISAGIGLTMYIIGWQVVVGTIGEDRQAKTITIYYFVIGLFAIALVIFWVIRLTNINNSI